MNMRQSKVLQVQQQTKKDPTPRTRKKTASVDQKKSFNDLSARCGVSLKSFKIAISAAQRLPSEVFGAVSRWIETLANLEANDRRDCAVSISTALETLTKTKDDPLADVDEPMGFPEALRVHIRAEREINASRNMILSDSLSAEDAAETFGRSRQNLEAWRRSNRVIALRVGNQWRYPTWQFDPDEVGGIVAGIREVIAGLRMSPAGTAMWLIQPSSRLKGKRPIDLLHKGYTSEVVQAAEELGHTP